MKKALRQLLAADGVEVFHLFHLRGVTEDHLRRGDKAAGHLIASIMEDHQKGFTLLPVLADALEDAGWSDAVALRRLRKASYPRGRVLIATGRFPISALQWEKKFTASTPRIAFRKPAIPMLRQVSFSRGGVGFHTFVSLTGAHLGQSVVESGSRIYEMALGSSLCCLKKRQYQAIPVLRYLYRDRPKEPCRITVVTEDTFFYENSSGDYRFCLFALNSSVMYLCLDWDLSEDGYRYPAQHRWLFGLSI